MGVGFRLKEILRDKKMTIKKLAEITGIPVNTLYSITKRDSDRVDYVILSKIAEALNVTVYKLQGIDDPLTFDAIQKINKVDFGKNVYIAPKKGEKIRDRANNILSLFEYLGTEKTKRVLEVILNEENSAEDNVQLIEEIINEKPTPDNTTNEEPNQ